MCNFLKNRSLLNCPIYECKVVLNIAVMLLKAAVSLAMNALFILEAGDLCFSFLMCESC